MKLEFLDNGSLDCPLVRLYAFDSTEAVRLREVFRSLSDGACESFDLHNDPSVEAIDGCQLILQLRQKDLGIIRRGRSTFNCAFSAETWRNIAALVEPFCESATHGHYQWLTEKGDASLLLSPDGGW
ncbi:MAG: hypothetical protein ACLQGV_18350 [Bryobacteraceae bacterium]